MLLTGVPAVDVGKSVSRVGGKTQLQSYRSVAGDLRLSYAQFEELETFSRFGTRLDETTRQTLEHGRRVREVLKQPQYLPLAPAEQIAILLDVVEGVFDAFVPEEIAAAERAVCHAVREQLPALCTRIEAGEVLQDIDRGALVQLVREAVITPNNIGAGGLAAAALEPRHTAERREE